MKTFITQVVKKITIPLKIEANTFEEARKKALEVVNDWDFTNADDADKECYVKNIEMVQSIQRKNDITIGEDIFDAEVGEFCTVIKVINSNVEKKYEVRGTKKDNEIVTWYVNDKDAYQFAHGRLCPNGHLICYEHNDEMKYPYYCPLCNENFNEIDTIRIHY